MNPSASRDAPGGQKVPGSKAGSKFRAEPAPVAGSARTQFSVTKGTIFEDSKIPLQFLLSAMYRMCDNQ
jgi:hypothetical protein